MKYMGSKARFCKDILPIILKNRKSLEQWYVEPFAGGMNTICKVEGKRMANDNNFYLIEMWKELVKGWQPEKISKEDYIKIRANKENFAPHIVGWVGFNCSYSGKWFGGFAGETKTKIGTIRDYQEESLRNVFSQTKEMNDVCFSNVNFLDLELPKDSIIYCDPPYAETTKY